MTTTGRPGGLAGRDAAGLRHLLAAVAAIAGGTAPCSLCDKRVPVGELRPPLKTLPGFLLCDLCAPLVAPPPNR